jgi:outer membrane protein insertion porin family
MLAAMFLGALGFAPLQAQPVVKQVIVTNVGPAAASASLVKANIKVKEGDPYNPSSIDNDVRNLYTTGYFMNVRVVEDRAGEGITLIYVLQGKPRVTDIIFVGNRKFSNAKLRKKLTTKLGEPLDERKLFTDQEELRKLYQKSGYQQTQVRYVPNIDERVGRGTVTFEIQETPKIKITDVVFDGAQAFKQSKLRRTVKTRRHWMFSWLTGSGKLKDDVLEDDKERLTEFYFNEGYVDFELKDVQRVAQSSNKTVVHFVVSEGSRYQVGAVNFKGQAIFTSNQLDKALSMNAGSTFTPRGLQKDIDSVKDTYGTKGYIDTRVIARKNPNTQTGTMDLTYELEEGEKSYIEKIDIKGNTKTKDKVIRRELAVSPGEVFDMVRVKLSRTRLEGTGLFEGVDMQPEPTEISNRKNLIVGLKEGQTGHMSFGAGFSSIESLFAYVEYREGNFQLPWFRGGGQKLRLRLSLGFESQNYRLDFVEPWLFGRKLELNFSLYHRRLDYVSDEDLYHERRTGGRIGLRRALVGDYLIGGVSYTLENIGIFDVDHDAPYTIQQEEGDRLVSKGGLSLAYDTRRYDPRFISFVPVGGQQTELTTELAGGPFGADTDFYRLDLGTAWYFKGLLRGHILEIGGHIGVVDDYGRSDSVPLFDRYFLGGLDTLRGFKYRAVGPREVNSVSGESERIGGETYWYGSVEYSIPIIEFLRLAVFYDIGMVYPNAFSFTQGYINFDSDPAHPVRGTEKTGFYNDNWGVGLRLNIPRLGPLRLDYGIPITADDHNDSSGRFQFSVGYTRNF